MSNEKDLKANNDHPELSKKAISEKIVEEFDHIETVEDITTAGYGWLACC